MEDKIKFGMVSFLLYGIIGYAIFVLILSTLGGGPSSSPGEEVGLTVFLLIGVLTMLSRLFGPDFTSDLKFFVFLGVTGLPLGRGSGAGWYFNEQSYDET